MKPPRGFVLSAAVWSALFLYGSASADAFTGGPLGGFTPRVPVSALARPAAWFDPSRLHISSSVSVGSGFGRGTEALQVMSLSYRFQAPMWMNVSLGNTWGPSAPRSGGSFFLEGLDAGYRPFSNLEIQIHYRDLRSPLQLSNDPFRGSWSR